ncbi:MAG TPA: GAF domain-containing protein, partial [Micromonospora sp.]
MLLDHHRVVRDVTTRLPDTTTALDACRATVSVLGRHAPARVSVLLWSHDRLRPVAGTGRWQGDEAVTVGAEPSDAVISRVYTSGKTETVAGSGDGPTAPVDDRDPGAADRICAPIPALDGRPIGVLDVESTSPLDLDSWRDTAERVAGRLGIRIVQLGGLPGESRDERLLRHTRAIWSAGDEPELVRATLEAVRDISGLPLALLALAGPAGPELVPPLATPGPLETRIRALLTGSAGGAAGSGLTELVRWVRRHGAGHTTGTADRSAPDGTGPLPAVEVGTLVAVPVGAGGDGGVLLLADERPLAPDPTTVNLVRM